MNYVPASPNGCSKLLSSENVDNVSPSLRDDLFTFLLTLDDEDYASAAEFCGRVSEDLETLADE